MNTGIDYGNGKTNIDTQTGIRLGVISQHSLNPDASQDIWDNGRDLTFEAFQNEAKDKLRNALSDYFSDRPRIDGATSDLADAVESAFDAISDDLNEQYQPDSPSMLYEKDGYSVSTCLDADLCVQQSKFYTFAQYCSPCVPGACNLDSPMEDGAKCYCFGHDWFEDNKAPYPVYSVESGQLVNPE